MDDPAHLEKRSTDLNSFRKGKFARAQSWQGDGPSITSKAFFSNANVVPPPRPSSTNLPPLAFAAASVAQVKRGRGLTIAESEEDDHADTSFASSSDGGLGEGGSPCPRSLADAHATITAAKPLRPRLMHMNRAQTSPFLSLGAGPSTGSLARI